MSVAVQPTQAAPAHVIHPATRMGTVHLTVRDLASSRDFYERVLGLQAAELEDGSLAFGPVGERPLVALRGDAAAPPLDRRATGLFHQAILLPTRHDLAVALARLAQARWPLDGASDHLVSEALYLSDPDGNGIELYRDRPREEWPRLGGQLQMATQPLDLHDLLGELREDTEIAPLAPSGTTIGHVHLQVSELADIERFYAGALGFDVTVRGYPGALFISAGGYHHHLGLNTWYSAGAAPPAAGAVGLRHYEVLLPTDEALEQTLTRVREAGVAIDSSDGAALIRDPSGNRIALRAC